MYNIPENGYAIIIGSMKCGTSALYGQLIKSPEVCRCKRKEPEFFSKAGAEQVDRKRYEALWDFNSDIHRIALEGSTGYTKYPAVTGVPAKIKACGLSPKFIYMVRNPFERILSHYFHNRANEGVRGDISHHLPYYIELSSYYHQLQQYRAHFPDSSILVVDFHDFKQDPVATVTRCCDFLGIANDFFSEYRPDGTQNKTFYYSKVQMQVSDHPLLSSLSRAVPHQIKEIIKKRMVRPFCEEDVLTPKVKSKVKEALRNDAGKLAETYNINISRWGF